MSHGNNGFRSAAAVHPSINLFLIYLARYALFSRVSLSLSLQIGSDVRRSSVNPSSILRTGHGRIQGLSSKTPSQVEVGWTRLFNGLLSQHTPVAEPQSPEGGRRTEKASGPFRECRIK